MSEVVRHRLEDTIPAMHDLSKNRLLSESEVQAVVAKRKGFEYALLRADVSTADYYRYIDYESKLDALRRKRKRKIGILSTNGPSEGAFFTNVNGIFKRSLFKFPKDIHAWLAYFQFLNNENAKRYLSRAFGRCLRVHAHRPSLWILAANWEWKTNAHVRTARKLLARARGTIRGNGEVLLESMRFELLQLSEVVARRKILGISAEHAPSASEKNEMASATRAMESGAKSVTIDPDEDTEDEEGDGMGWGSAVEDGDSDEEEYDSEADEDSEDGHGRMPMAKRAPKVAKVPTVNGWMSFFEGAIPKRVYETAMEVPALASDLEFRTSILSLFLEFADMVPKLYKVVSGDVKRDFPNAPMVILAEIRGASSRKGDIPSPADRTARYLEALRPGETHSSSPVLWESFLSHLWEGAVSKKLTEEKRGVVMRRICGAARVCKARGATTPLVFRHWVLAARGLGEYELAAKIAAAATSTHPSDAKVAALEFSMKMTIPGSVEMGGEDVEDDLERMVCGLNSPSAVGSFLGRVGPALSVYCRTPTHAVDALGSAVARTIAADTRTVDGSTPTGLKRARAELTMHGCLQATVSGIAPSASTMAAPSKACDPSRRLQPTARTITRDTRRFGLRNLNSAAASKLKKSQKKNGEKKVIVAEMGGDHGAGVGVDLCVGFADVSRPNTEENTLALAVTLTRCHAALHAVSPSLSGCEDFEASSKAVEKVVEKVLMEALEARVYTPELIYRAIIALRGAGCHDAAARILRSATKRLRDPSSLMRLLSSN